MIKNILSLHAKRGWIFMMASCCLVSACKDPQTATVLPDLNLTQYVDPFIGTGDHGHVFLGADVPFGAVQLGPTNYSQGWDWCSGYHITDSTIIGFAHTHLSGTGIGDLGDIALMPVVGKVAIEARGNLNDPATNYFSKFSHKKEKARPGYYAVHLDRYGIDVELTATQRVGFHKYQFPATDDAKVILDLNQGIGWDAMTSIEIKQENDTVISGYRYSKGWARDQRLYFTATFSQAIKVFTLHNNNAYSDPKKKENPSVVQLAYAELDFGKQTPDQALYVKVALSPVSVDGAKANMKAELPGWDFATTQALADKAWNDELNKIQIKADPTEMRIFYTALYHTMIAPSVFSDVDGSYCGVDKKIYTENTFKNYTTFSLWDTYRAAHPLMTLIHQEKMADIINTMLAIYQQQGKLPVWHLVGNETDCMVGNPGIPVVADAILKDFKGFDYELAFEAMKNSALLDERGLDWVKKDYIPGDKVEEAVAKALEYCLADWSIAQVAQKMGKTADYELFSQRALAYQKYFDPQTQFMRGKMEDGSWRTPFSPFHAAHRQNDYTEGNAWQYTWLVPHDVDGLVKLFGGKEQFITKLDSLFVVTGDMGAEASPDISGLIGQYAHGNEPSHHIIYLYSMVGEPRKAAFRVRQTLSTLYTDQPAGLSGNEDVGQMSAWYVLSALGFYQVAPAGGEYIFGSPMVQEAHIKLPNNKTLHITAKNNSKENIYIQSIEWNGKPLSKHSINFKDLNEGGELVLNMGL